jgi:N-glycosylase/DNA lyase
MTWEEIEREYTESRSEIRTRLEEFSKIWDQGDPSIFRELCFCILAANSSAEMGMKTLTALEDLLDSGSVEEMQERLSGRFRYWRVRPAYIVSTRDYLNEICGLQLRGLIESFPDSDQRRAFFAENRRIRGIGYKEASHFLRNIGFRGYAILDKHILSCLRELKVIGSRLFPTPGRRYRLIERRMIRFSERCGIGMDELDLVLWKHKTGKILK